ncbi:uncharacterized protein LOC127527487 [Erpetoichthys calabaricus]|uniref:uncharacterized protein LOC127527487 n=1 Tax=Erpetoichthys calabaricus TaxID=27687 RepID=UPI00223426D4|nr:uncharacterized protein LOC127527487 [Erpetoichthys calabaricus]
MSGIFYCDIGIVGRILSQKKPGWGLKTSQVGKYQGRVSGWRVRLTVRKDTVQALLQKYSTVEGTRRRGLLSAVETKGAYYVLSDERAEPPMGTKVPVKNGLTLVSQVKKIKHWKFNPDGPIQEQAMALWTQVVLCLRPCELTTYQIVQQVACYFFLQGLPDNFTQPDWGDFHSMDELIWLIKRPMTATKSRRAEWSSSGFPREYISHVKPLLHKPEPVPKSAGCLACNLSGNEVGRRWMGGERWCALTNALSVTNRGVVLLNGHKLTALFDSSSNVTIVAHRYVLPRQLTKRKTSVKCIQGEVRNYKTALCYICLDGSLRKHPPPICGSPPQPTFSCSSRAGMV